MIGSPLGARERSPDPQRLEPGELTPVHQRASRRLRGDPPEFGPLPTAPATQASSTANERRMVSPVTSELIVSPPRNLFDSNSHCRNVEYQRTPTLCANPSCTVLRLQPPVAVHRLRAAHLFKEI
ncbi:hypothetical protein HPB52_001410 [Rhipicephalus sanguineus]|uniref:Uncharacterized protein n=1 Tax=Rhipicephalus sanguineus TaxID=34632 RepID=A0A9D4PAX3_RHISA|nr:hypothetical protein HPB52_001410 [Rhipicephalus sanguineus]